MTVTLLALIASTMAFFGTAVVVIRARRGAEAPVRMAQAEHRSVHILQSEEELRAAVQRAALFDQRAAQVLQSRSTRYRALMTEAPSDGSPS